MPSTMLRHRRSVRFLIPLWLGLIILADWLFYDRVLGWTLGLYCCVLGVALIVRTGASLRSASERLAVCVWLGIAVALVFDPSVLAVTLGVAALLSSSRPLATCRPGRVLVDCASRTGVMLLTGWSRIFRDFRLFRRGWPRQRSGGAVARVLARWSIPLACTFAFLVLFHVANPIIAQWLERLGRFVERVLRTIYLPSPERILFWLLSAIWIWALLRERPSWRRLSAHVQRLLCGTRALSRATDTLRAIDTRQAARVAADWELAGPAFLIRCLSLFNLLFLMHNLLDLRYLWAGAALPPGMTYAQYAHRGAYPLVATALLAATFVLATFRRNTTGPAMRWPRRLVLLWLGQNVFLTVSSVFRLCLYVRAYTLSRLRVAAAVWMVLIACGLLLIVWRIVRAHDNVWLLNANLGCLFAVLYVCCFCDIDGFIANYNVDHAWELAGEGPALDLKYLERLGPEAIPALERFCEHATPAARVRKARELEAHLREQLAYELSEWRGWTWERARLARH